MRMDEKTRKRGFALAVWSLFLSSFIVHGKAAVSRKRVCVIGAGASGLTSLKHLLDNPNQFEPIVFEKKSDVGGQWLYTDNVSDDQFGLPVQSSVYASLRTNGAKELLAFPDYQNFSSPEQRSCVRHQDVFQYLQNFTNYYNLRQYIRFNTLVENVTPKNPTSAKANWKKTKWLLSAWDANVHKRYKIICHAIMVCNGINTKPLIPSIPGIDSFPGLVLHSHVYRKPEGFTGRTVLLLGSGSSAVDLALDLSPYSKTVYLSHQHDKLMGDFPSNVMQVPRVASINGSQLTLENASKIDVDTFIFCTGYVQDMPFLDTNTGIQVHEKSVDYLYKYIVNIEYPSMGFIGIAGSFIINFPRFYLQAQYYIALLADKTDLPSKSEMFQDQLNISRSTNYTEWDYHADIASIGNLEPLASFYERGIKLWVEMNSKDKVHFKEYNMRILSNGDVEIYKPSSN